MTYIEKQPFTVSCEYSEYKEYNSGQDNKQYVFETDHFVLGFTSLQDNFGIKIILKDSKKNFYIVFVEIDCNLDFTRLFTDGVFFQSVKSKIEDFCQLNEANFWNIDLSDKRNRKKEIIHMFKVQKNQEVSVRKAGGIKKNVPHQEPQQSLKEELNVNEILNFTFNESAQKNVVFTALLQPLNDNKVNVKITIIQPKTSNSVDMNKHEMNEIIENDILEIRKSQTDFQNSTATNKTNLNNNKDNNSGDLHIANNTSNAYQTSNSNIISKSAKIIPKNNVIQGGEKSFIKKHKRLIMISCIFFLLIGVSGYVLFIHTESNKNL
jgi:hypothetical protein